VCLSKNRRSSTGALSSPMQVPTVVASPVPSPMLPKQVLAPLPLTARVAQASCPIGLAVKSLPAGAMKVAGMASSPVAVATMPGSAQRSPLAGTPQTRTPQQSPSHSPQPSHSFRPVARSSIAPRSLSPCLLVSPPPPPVLQPAPVAVVGAAVAKGEQAIKEIALEGRTFEFLRELGRGSFGAVMEVREKRPEAEGSAMPQELVALKWSTPARKELHEACVFEAAVLKQLASVLPAGSNAARRVPRHVAHGCFSSKERLNGPMGPATAGFGHFLLAMSKMEGRPLDRWLYGVDEQVLKTLPVEQLLHGPLKDSRLGSRDLAGACNAAARLLAQMAPVFQALESVAFHRDLSAHNFLISCPEDGGSGEQFAVIDFGLAVGAGSWKQEWNVRNIAGDPRYFAPAAWMLLAYGHKYLQQNPDQHLLRQYKDRIDHFAMGVLAMEVFFALWKCPAAQAELEPAERSLVIARAAWHAYWGDAMRLFQRFHAEGAQRFRQVLARSQAMWQFVEHLQALCKALRAAADLQPDPAVAAVLRLSAGLLDWRSTTPSWQQVAGGLAAVGVVDAPLPPAAAEPGRGLALAPAAGPPAAELPASAARARSNSVEVKVEVVSEIEKEDASQAEFDTTPNSKSLRRFVPTCTHRRVRTVVAFEGDGGGAHAAFESTGGKAAEGKAVAVIVEGMAAVVAAAAAEGKPGEAAAPMDGASARAPIPVGGPRKTFAHRRHWTVDEGMSLRRGVLQVGIEDGGAQQGV